MSSSVLVLATVVIFRIPQITHHSAVLFRTVRSAFYFPHSAFRNSAFYRHPDTDIEALSACICSSALLIADQWLLRPMSHVTCVILDHRGLHFTGRWRWTEKRKYSSALTTITYLRSQNSLYIPSPPKPKPRTGNPGGTTWPPGEVGGDWNIIM